MFYQANRASSNVTGIKLIGLPLGVKTYCQVQLSGASSHETISTVVAPHYAILTAIVHINTYRQ